MSISTVISILIFVCSFSLGLNFSLRKEVRTMKKIIKLNSFMLDNHQEIITNQCIILAMLTKFDLINNIKIRNNLSDK